MISTARMDNTHLNPVKHGLVAHPADWPYSSFGASSAGYILPGWRGGSDEPQQAGERL